MEKPQKLSPKLDVAIQVAISGGTISKNMKRVAQVRFKDKFCDIGSMVTDADLKSEKAIVSKIEERFPSHNIHGEEETDKQKESDFTWYIDPLDGTSNYAREIPLYGISVGLVRGKQPVLGVLYFPEQDLLLYAERGKGAHIVNGGTCVGNIVGVNLLPSESVHVSNRPIEKSLYYGRTYFRGKSYFLDSLAKRFGLTKIVDASSWELAQIAMGNAELYLCPSVLHDVVAGVAIIREAGGKVTDYEGNEWNTSSDGIVATNGVIHDEVIQHLKKEPLPEYWRRN